MAFGLIQWLISFTIFLIVLTVITWSAVHLGKKSQNSTDSFILRFLDANDYSIERENKSHHSTIVRDSTSQVVESTDNLTLFANDQGSEIPDSAQFYEIWRTFFLIENNTINSTNYDTATATFVSSVVGNNSTWNDDTALYNMSDKTFVLDDHRNVSEKVTISPDHISQTAYSAHLTHEAKLFDMDKLWKSDLSHTVRTELSEFLQDKKNGTSNMSIISSFTRALSYIKQSNMTQQTKTIYIVK